MGSQVLERVVTSPATLSTAIAPRLAAEATSMVNVNMVMKMTIKAIAITTRTIRA